MVKEKYLIVIEMVRSLPKQYNKQRIFALTVLYHLHKIENEIKWDKKINNKIHLVKTITVFFLMFWFKMHQFIREITLPRSAKEKKSTLD